VPGTSKVSVVQTWRQGEGGGRPRPHPCGPRFNAVADRAALHGMDSGSLLTRDRPVRGAILSNSQAGLSTSTSRGPGRGTGPIDRLVVLQEDRKNAGPGDVRPIYFQDSKLHWKMRSDHRLSGYLGWLRWRGKPVGGGSGQLQWSLPSYVLPRVANSTGTADLTTVLPVVWVDWDDEEIL
jgi:hypothetical protein